MKAIHCVSSLAERHGGPSVSVPELAQAVARRGWQVELVTVADSDGARSLPAQTGMPRTEDHGVVVHSFASSGDGRLRGLLAASGELQRYLCRDAAADVYHGHCMWQLPVHYLARAARRKRRPYLLAPHGMAEPWALRRSPWRKRLVSALYQRRDLVRADCLHALNAGEMEHMRGYGLTNPVAILPNGFECSALDPALASVGREEFAAEFTAAKDRPFALFLSRIHPKKGLVPLLRGWAGLAPEARDDWLLVIGGPDQLGHRAEVERLAAELRLQRSVLFTGPLFGRRKLAAEAAARFFVLPSYSEGFSMALLEAMACRLPLLITSGCNFPEVAAQRAGLVCPAEPAGLGEGLRRLIEMSDGERAEMGARGRRMVEQHYAWDRIAAKTLEVYGWLLGRPACAGGGRPPDCVVTE